MRRKRIREFEMMEEIVGEMNTDTCCIAKDVEAVVTSFNQGTMLLEAVRSLCGQTTFPSRIFIVDDGSTDEKSVNILNDIKASLDTTVPIVVIRQANCGVSAARNMGTVRWI